MKLNLINKEISEIKYDITRFPDGEPQFSFIEELDRKESIDVICRISNTEDLFLLMQVGDILSRQEIDWDLDITYLISMRMDRVIDFNRPFSLKVVCNILNTLSYKYIRILEPHSNKVFDLLGSRCLPWNFKHSNWIDPQSNIVYPNLRARYNYSQFGYLIFNKKRNPSTGKIESFEIEKTVNCYYSTFVFVDDLCDTEETFLGELEVLKKKYPNSKFVVIVCHAINDRSIANMCDNFDQVFISNSYKDISYSRNNLTVIDVCK